MGQRKFSVIPVRSVEDRNLHEAGLRVLAAFGTYMDHDGICSPSQSEIARWLKVSQQAIGRQIKILEKLGYIEITHRADANNGTISSKYRICFEEKTGGTNAA